MAEPITMQKLIDASMDSDSLETLVNGDENTQVTTRTGATYPSAKKAVNTLFTNGGLPAQPFATKALMNASALANGSYAQVIDDTINNGLYVKTEGVWVKSEYDPFLQAKNYVDTGNVALINQVNTSVDEKVDVVKIDVMSGTDIYYKAEDNPSQVFSAIWSDYSKPVWHIGNRVIVDVTGARVSVVKEELVFTIKLTAANQTFIYPTRANTIPEQYARVDWGDGIVADYTNYNISHTYAGAIGDEFQIRVSGNPLHFDFSIGNGSRRTSALMIKSIDKNTMPKTMPYFYISACTNLTYLARGAFSSWTGTTFKDARFSDIPNLVFNKDAFKGCNQITNIDYMLGYATKGWQQPIPAGLFDPFVNVVSAEGALYKLGTALPLGFFDKMLNLQNVKNLFMSATITMHDSNMFKNQTKLSNVNSCFRLNNSAVANAQTLYTDMLRGNPTDTALCFNGAASMTNLASVPSTWK